MGKDVNPSEEGVIDGERKHWSELQGKPNRLKAVLYAGNML
jgi:hypothetical protein